MVDYELTLVSSKRKVSFLISSSTVYDLPKTVCFGPLLRVDYVISRAVPLFQIQYNEDKTVRSITLPFLSDVHFGAPIRSDACSMDDVAKAIIDICNDFNDAHVVPFYCFNEYHFPGNNKAVMQGEPFDYLLCDASNDD